MFIQSVGMRFSASSSKLFTKKSPLPDIPTSVNVSPWPRNNTQLITISSRMGKFHFVRDAVGNLFRLRHAQGAVKRHEAEPEITAATTQEKEFAAPFLGKIPLPKSGNKAA